MSFFTPGKLSIISGTMGSGKTDYALRLVEVALHKSPGIKIISNIRMEKKVPNYVWVNDIWGLLGAMVQVNHGLLVLDEAGIFGSSGSSGRKKETGQWEQIIKLSRKFGLATIWIDQRVEGSVLPTVRELASYHFWKPSKFQVIIYDGGKVDAKEIHRIRLTVSDRTTLPFNTYDIGSFAMVLPMDYTVRDVFNYLSNYPPDEVRKRLKLWLDEIETKQQQIAMEKKENIRSDDDPRAGVSVEGIIRFLMDKYTRDNNLDPGKDWKKYPKTVDLSRILLVSEQYVGRKKKIWKEDKLKT